MRIAIFYNLYFSGAKRTVYEHARGLKRLGHTVDVYTLDSENDIFDPGSVSDNEYRYSYSRKIISLPFLKSLTRDLSDFYLLPLLHKRIAKDIDKRKYDITLIHTDKLTQAPYILKYLKTESVYFCLEPLKMVYEYGLRIPDNFSFFNKVYEFCNRSMRKVIDRNNARAAKRTLAISYFGRELMIQSFDLYPKISYLGVDTSVFRKLDIPKKNQVLFVGQKEKMNGYENAVEAINRIPQEIRPKLQVLSISKNKTKRISDTDMVKLYNESIVTLSLSNFDTFGLVPLESLACETPVVAYNVAGYRETMINGKTGYLVDFDVNEIAEKITALIKNPAEAHSMGVAGRKWVEKNWQWSTQIRNLEKILIQYAQEKTYETF